VVIAIDDEFRAKAEDKERPRFSYIGSEISTGVNMIITSGLAEMLHVPVEVVVNYRYNEYCMTHGLADAVRPMSIPVNYSVVWEGGKHGVAKTLKELMDEGIIKDGSRFPQRFHDPELSKDKDNQLAMVPPQETQIMSFAPSWSQARADGIKLIKAYKDALKAHGIKTKYGAESGLTTEQMRDKNGRLITLELILDDLKRTIDSFPLAQRKYFRAALDFASSEMYIPEIDMYYIGPEAAGNDDGLVTNSEFTAYKLKLLQEYPFIISVEDWADESKIEHWEDAKAIMPTYIQMGDDNIVSRGDLIRKFKDVMNACLQKPNQSAWSEVEDEAVGMSHQLGNVVIGSHRGTRSPQEVYTAQFMIGVGAFGGKWTLWGPGRSALIAVMTQADTLFNSGLYPGVTVPYQGALVLDPNGPYKDYGWANKLRAEIAAAEANEGSQAPVASSPLSQGAKVLPVSSATDTKRLGGIDFKNKAMQVTYKPMGDFSSLNVNLPKLSLSELKGFDIDGELNQLEVMVSRQLLPSANRIKEILAACTQKKGNWEAERQRLLTLLVKMGLLEEQLCYGQECSREYKEALVIADTLLT